ncbi:MFS transporter [Gynuella sp.]|uniref:MFS transporter n=1 Tax=Gynuella sp. TaxID=2969146 RepID=UPI003D0A7232
MTIQAGAHTKDMDQPVKKREIFGWAMYDFANSAYTTVVITIVYSAFFVNYLVPEGAVWQDSYWSIAIVISTVLAMLLAPITGILCDFSGRKKIFLGITTLLCALFTAMLGLVNPGQIWLGIFIVVISNTAWMLGEVFCASFLTDIANQQNMGKISGIGWGVGYVGALISLIIALKIVITADPDTETSAFISQNQLAMVFTGLFFLLAALPTFLLVKERSKPQPGFETIHFPTLLKASIKRLAHTWTIVHQLPILFQFFLVFLLYMAGIEIIVKFFGIYVEAELKFTTAEKTNIFLALQISALFGAVAFGYLESAIGPKKTIFLSLVWWIVGTLAIYFLRPVTEFLGISITSYFTAVALMTGAGLGATQSASRAIVGLLSPKKYSAELFGFWGFFAKGATILGSLSYSLVADTMGRESGLLVIVGFFALGAITILLVPLEKGLKMAREE